MFLFPWRRSFLTAQWRLVTLLNYEAPPELLRPHVPRGTELDFHEGKTYVSLVGFLFLHTRLLGLGVPWHRHFEEVNLRFYVRHRTAEGWRRGVVFLKELVAKPAVSCIARAAYNENYETVDMRHRIAGDSWNNWGGLLHNGCDDSAVPASPFEIEYAWRKRGRRDDDWCSLQAHIATSFAPLVPQSHEEFLLEHYYGYCRQRNGGTVEYRVEHPPWQVAAAQNARLNGDLQPFYGPALANLLAQPPCSAFVANGSAIAVRFPRRVEESAPLAPLRGEGRG